VRVVALSSALCFLSSAVHLLPYEPSGCRVGLLPLPLSLPLSVPGGVHVEVVPSVAVCVFPSHTHTA
jgi:hypothetical protein